MKEKMDSRNRVLTAMHHQKPDRVPVDLSWGMSPGALEKFTQKTGAKDPDDYFETDIRFVGLEVTRGFGLATGEDEVDEDWMRKEAEFRKILGPLPDKSTVTEWGTGHAPGSEHHFTRIIFPMANISTSEEITNYPFPTFDENWRLENAKHDIQKYHKRGLCVGGAAACSIFEVSWQLRGMERLLEDFVERPDLASTLLDRVTEIRCGYVESLVNLDSDILILGDDIATQIGMLMSPKMWRYWLKPRLSKIIETARRLRPDILVFYHSDGNPSAVIPDLIEIGVNILNPVQPECVDVVKIKNQYGSQLALWGTIGTQTTFPFGTPQEMRDLVKLRMETVGKDGGLLLGPTHMLEPDVPWENIVAFFEAVKEFGVY
jgi:uroporphyrinogen decarboxylase